MNSPNQYLGSFSFYFVQIQSLWSSQQILLMKSILCGLSTDIFLKVFVFKSSRECNSGNPQSLATSVYDNFSFSLIKGYIYPFVFCCLYLLC